ncbi:glycosyltransferase [Dyadobacter tibetensis]|uniref:glycosyltransferase n=1 Tax=Dyadobacter tibetensis TaxID=1211851 RepID=UPI0005C659E2|nr:glycosyltransferase [Dyadobacter tibetensis]
MIFQPAPILLFTYKRLATVKKTIEALKENALADESDLYIFSDGPKNEKDAEIIACLRDYLKTVTGFRNITIYESRVNKGLASSIIDGVSLIIKQSEKVIVLEDDLITTKNFLQFMNLGLESYHTNTEVLSISGYSFNLGEKQHNDDDAYFLNRGWSWGWATWLDRWDNVDWSVNDYPSFKNNLKARKEFAKGGSDLNAMLDKQMEGSLDSWAIRWFYHQFKTKTLTLYPVYSKIFNEGFDSDATHTTGSERRYIPNIDKLCRFDFQFPKTIALSKHFQKKFNDKMGLQQRFLSKLESYIVKFSRNFSK